MSVQQTHVQTDRVVTVPNVLSALRLVGIPLFLWLVLSLQAYGWAAVVLILSALTDYLDGMLARRWNQISRVGQLLDPVADRLYVIAALVAFGIEGIVPWWLVGVLFARDLVLALTLPSLRRMGYVGLPVHFLGKAATACLLAAFPALLLGASTAPLANEWNAFGWALLIWGTFLYWWAAVVYLVQVRGLRRASPATAPSPLESGGAWA